MPHPREYSYLCGWGGIRPRPSDAPLPGTSSLAVKENPRTGKRSTKERESRKKLDRYLALRALIKNGGTKEEFAQVVETIERSRYQSAESLALQTIRQIRSDFRIEEAIALNPEISERQLADLLKIPRGTIHYTIARLKLVHEAENAQAPILNSTTSQSLIT